MKEKTITFKSIPKYYEIEETDQKNNTVRNTKDWDFEKWKEFIFAKTIIIKNTDNKNTLFQRTIKNKVVWNGYAIITWKEKSL